MPEIAERPGAQPLERARGAIEICNVSFHFDVRKPVLRGVNLELKPGAHVGIVGESGAGKTTLVSLLTRLHDPTAGAILLDGIDLRDYKLADLRNQFSIVLQDPVLFSTTIAENIAYTRPSATRGEVIRAAKLANADEFIQCLPNGYNTQVGARGASLSGGERQRIALARAFLKDAPILIFDEPTSSVDFTTEAGIVEATQTLMQGRTAFIVAHRVRTLQHCELLFELKGGRLAPSTLGAALRLGSRPSNVDLAPQPGFASAD
jgi:ATP-binding cassette subfamily B protein